MSNSLGTPPKGFVSVPTLEDLRLTDREIYLLKLLLQWQESSRHSCIMLGPGRKPFQKATKET